MMKTTCLAQFSVRGEEGLCIQQPQSVNLIMSDRPDSLPHTSLDSDNSIPLVMNPYLNSVLVDGTR
jgi:hypothetical protein